MALIREGRAEILMKGSLHTDEVLAAVLDKVTGVVLQTEGPPYR